MGIYSPITLAARRCGRFLHESYRRAYLCIDTIVSLVPLLMNSGRYLQPNSARSKPCRTDAELLAESPRKMTRFHKPASGGHFTNLQRREPPVSEDSMGALQSNSHQFITECRVVLREYVMKIAFGYPEFLGQRTGSQLVVVAAVSGRTLHPFEECRTVRLRVGSGISGQCQEAGDLLADDAA